MRKERRSGRDRRSNEDGRRLFSFYSPFYAGVDRRRGERRRKAERRSGWVRVSEWSSKTKADFEKLVKQASDIRPGSSAVRE